MKLKDFLTERQFKIYELYKSLGCNGAATARKLGISRQNANKTIRDIKVKLAKVGISDTMDVSAHVMEGYPLKGTSTLVGEDGQVKLRWIKTDKDVQAQREAMEQALEAMCEQIPPVDPTPAPRDTLANLCNLYVITDYHLGMLAWEEETGDDWDIKIAEDMLIRWFDRAIELAPESEHAVFAQLGDFMHWDGLEAITPTSKHLLDADTRFHKLVRVAIRVLRVVINRLLAKHQRITVIMAEGNHDIASSIWLSEMFKVLYEHEPRITVNQSPDPYYCYEFGKTSLFFHHGHKKKFKTISDVFVAKFREIFGRTHHSYGHMGHMHHNLLEENNLMIVEQHRTLAARDAHASRGGWLSGRDAKVITYDSTHGEVGRIIVNYKQI